MSGPYFHGLGKRKWQSRESVSSDSENSDLFFSKDRYKTKCYKKRHVAPSDAEVIPKFRPEDNSSNVIGWLHKIDQLGDVYGWDDTDRTFIMQLRLRGAAREWYDDLENYDLTWDGWKETLQVAFPRSTDYVDKLERMMARTKDDKETMTKYYHEKLSLLKKCNIEGTDAISCVIRGLPAELRANAKAYSCDTPEQLYYGYLSSLENFKRVEAYTAPKSIWRRGGTSNTQNFTSSRQLQPKICYLCRRPGHEARDCKQQQRCETCRRSGHTTAACWFGAGTSRQQPQKVSRVLHITYDIYVDIYKKTVVVNGQQLRAYIDTGSKINILCVSQIENLQLKVEPSSTVMSGFGGSCVNSLGSCCLSVLVDNVTLKGTVELVNYITSDIDLLIGQTMINSENVSLVTSASSTRFVQSKVVQDLFENINLDISDFIVKFPVYLKHRVKIPKQNQLYVQVYIDCSKNIGKERTFLTNTVCMHLGNIMYLIPSAIINSCHSCLKIVNLGCTDIVWEAHRLIARAELVTIPEYGSESNILNIDASDTDSIQINLSDIDKGHLSDTENRLLLELLNKYTNTFARSTKDLGCTDLIKMQIRTVNNQPVYCKPYRLSIKENEIVNEKVKDLLEAGIIRESMSDYASPVVLVKKKGGDYRLCVDYRALNSNTIKDRYPLPHIEDQVNKLSGKYFFTTLDLAQGYYQVSLHEDSIPKTAFVTPSGQYEFLKMPFGLANAPAVFSRLIEMTLGRVDQNIALYLDDVMLPTTSVQEGLMLLEKVLKLLTQANLKLNLGKCSFLKRTATYLGHEISAGTIQPGQAKIKCVAQYNRPRNVHEIRQFIGLTSYFRKFIQNFAQIARPLTELTKKDVEWHWSSDQEKSFLTLKQRLIERPVLAIYNSGAKTELHTDASKIGLGGIFMQYQTDNSLKPVAYFSRVTSREEKHYHSYELETLAVVESLKRFRIYLTGIKVKVITDCSALRTTLVKRDLIPRIARWWLTIQEFDLEIEYRPGERMRHVDALSRNPVTSTTLIIENSDWLVTLQLQDDNIQNIISRLRDGSDSNLEANYIVKDNLLFRKTVAGERFVIPKLAKYGLLQKLHDQIGHPGFEKCESSVKAQFWFEGMTKFIRKYLSSCLQCAYNKGNYGRLEGELYPINKPAIPMHTLHADHLGPFAKTRKGNAYILVVIDAFTKFVFARPAKNCSSIETIRLLKEIIMQFGYPVRIITDRGKAFTSRYFKEFSQENQFKHVLNAIASPRSNGQVERVNRTLLNGLNTMSESECTWDNKLDDIVWGINNTPNATTGFSPFNLMFGHKNFRYPSFPSDTPSTSEAQQNELQINRKTAKFRIDKNMTTMKSRFDKKHKKCLKYTIGQLVLWKGGIARDATTGVTKKLSGLYTGPYKICKVEHSLDRYTIASIKGMKGYKKFNAVVRGETLRPYKPTISEDDSSDSDRDVDRDDLIDLLES